MAEIPRTDSSPPAAPAVANTTSLLRRVVRQVENVLFYLFVLGTVFYFILQLPSVQRRLVQWTTQWLSSELHTEVHIGRMYVSLFDNAVMEDVYLEDLKGDTLLYAGKLSASLNSNLLTLLNEQKLAFDEISLSHARLYLRRREGEANNNLQFLLDYFRSPNPKPKKSPTPFELRIQNLFLTDLDIVDDNAVRGQRQRYYLGSGAVRLRQMDLSKGIVDIQSINLNRFQMSMHRFIPIPYTGTVVSPAPTPTDTAARAPKVPLVITIGRLNLTDGAFTSSDANTIIDPTRPVGAIDWKNMAVRSVALQAEGLRIGEDRSITGLLRHLSAREKSGFELTHAEANQLVVRDTITALYGMKIQTPDSEIGDTLALHYERYGDYLRFTSKVKMDIRIAAGSQLRIGDIMYFSTPLHRNRFFQKNTERIADIAGHVRGKVKDLAVDQMKVGLGNGTWISGKFRGNDLDEGTDRLRLAFNFDRLQTNIHTIRDIVPGFNAPATFNKLGDIYYEGRYELLFGYNHILNGHIRTEAGYGKVDMELDLTNGTKNATYSGELDLRRFDMASWTGNRDFGYAAFNVRIKDGSHGLTLPTMRANLTGRMDSFSYRGYTYRDIKMDGSFEQYLFKGKLAVEDANVDFAFNGTVNLKDSIPQYSFSADIARLDLGKLNLVNEDWVVSGKADRIDLRFRRLSDIEGTAVVRNLRLVQDKEYVHRLDSLVFASGYRAGGGRYAYLRSDVGEAELNGRFNQHIFQRIGQMFSTYFPALTRQIGMASVSRDTLAHDVVQFNLLVRDTRSLTRLFAPDLDTIRNLRAAGVVDVHRGLAKIELDAPRIHYKNILLENTTLGWTGDGDNAEYDLTIPRITLPNGKVLPEVKWEGQVRQDRATIQIVAQDTSQKALLKSVNLRGVVNVTPDSLWQLRFDGSNIRLFNEQWLLDDQNSIRLGKQYFATEAFELMNGNRRILLDSLNGGRGVRLSFTNFNLNILNDILKKETLQLRGKIYDLEVDVQDMFALRDIKAYLNTDTIFVNNYPCGRLDGNVEWANREEPLWWLLFLRDGRQVVRSVGSYVLANENSSAPKMAEEVGEVRPGQFKTIVAATRYPIGLLQKFIPGISGLKGNASGSVTLGGPFDRVAMNGQLLLHTAEMQMDYLKAKFSLRNQRVHLTQYQIWAAGDTIYDESGKNMAFISKQMGGLRHDHFSNWTLDCELESADNNFQVLNTTKNDNSLFYGTARGKFRTRFTGTFVRPNIYVKATTGRQTVLYIPLDNSTDAVAKDFIKFVPKPNPADTLPRNPVVLSPEEIKGLNLEMNLTVTDAAEVQLIFDEQAGDIVKGVGEGDLLFLLNREGDFRMYGNYTIRRGEYLFTLLNFVKKPFTVNDGGTIRWEGDPLAAQINLDAFYNESASLYSLLRDELAITSGSEGQRANPLVAEAQRSQQVVVKMHLDGSLLKPNLRFDFGFPNLTGQLKSLVDSKMRQLNQDQSELSRQVFGLVVVGSFLPGNTGFIQNSDYLSSGINTVTQMLTNQLSSYLSGLASEWFGKKVSSIDFDIAYNEYRTALLNSSSAADQTGRELQLRLSSGFINDRVTVRVGSNFGLGRPDQAVANGYLGEDVTVEIHLTADRQWRLKVYQRSEPDVAGNVGTRRRYGFGLSFRKEYDSFAVMVKELNALFKKKGT